MRMYEAAKGMRTRGMSWCALLCCKEDSYRRAPNLSPYDNKACACAQRPSAAAQACGAAYKQDAARSRRLRDTLAAAFGLLAHALVTEPVKCCPMGPNLGTPRYCTEALVAGLAAMQIAAKGARAVTTSTYSCRNQGKTYFRRS